MQSRRRVGLVDSRTEAHRRSHLAPYGHCCHRIATGQHNCQLFVLVGELAIAGLAGGHLVDPVVVAPSRFQDVERDLAVVVADDTPAATVADTIRRHGGPLLRSVTLFDRYRGKPLGDREASLAYRLTFAVEDRTLTEAEVAAAVDGITLGLASDVEGRLRV